MESLTLFDYSDRELLHIVFDAQDEKTGYARTKDIADALGITGDRRNHSVGVRLAWLKRWGAVAKHESQSRWAVTQIGVELMNGDMTDRQKALVQQTDDGDALMLTREMTRKYRRSGVTAGHLIRREWKRGTS